VIALAVGADVLALPVSRAVGAFTLSSSATASFSATITGSDLTPTYTVALAVTDTRTTPTAGWNLTITSTQLTTTAPVHTLSTSASKVTGVAVGSCTGGACVAPVNSIAFPVTVPAGSTPPTAVKLYNAKAATGEGVYAITPTIQVSVPGNSFSGSYASTLTFSVVSGP
jgi:WxL domain surface cell wall-binding